MAYHGNGAGFLPLVSLLSHVTPSIRQWVVGLLQKGVVEKAQGKVILSYLFNFPKQDPSQDCLTINLSCLNKFRTRKFRMVTVRQVRLHLRGGAWLAALNLQDAYWNVSIHPSFKSFLHSKWDTKLFGMSIAVYNRNNIVRKLFCASVSFTMSRHQWEKSSWLSQLRTGGSSTRQTPPPSPMQP